MSKFVSIGVFLVQWSIPVALVLQNKISKLPKVFKPSEVFFGFYNFTYSLIKLPILTK